MDRRGGRRRARDRRRARRVAVHGLRAALGRRHLDAAPDDDDRPKPPPKPTAPEVAVPWPTYGYDEQRTRFAADSPLRPPFRHVWLYRARTLLEFPPAIAYGNLYVPVERGIALALDAKTGKVVWAKHYNACLASSPTVWRRVVYFAMMNPCAEPHDTAQGLVVALAAKTGQGALALPARSRRVVTRRRPRHALCRVARRQALRDQRAHREAALVVHRRRRDQGRRRLRGPQGLLRGLRRQRLRARRPHREARLEGGRRELDRPRPRTVLCEPGDRLRPRVHRGHRRRRVRVRRRHRGAPLGAGHGRICLRLGRDLERDGLRRLLRPPLLRPRCRDGRGALVVLGQRPDLRARRP